MTVHLIHGFNVSDGGKDTIRKMEPFIKDNDVIAHDYGWTFLFGLRCKNAEAIQQIARRLTPGDVLAGHSNAAWIIWQLTEKYPEIISGVVVINPALRRDTLWHENIKVMCIYNSTDIIVELGRIWARLVSFGKLNFHGWGAAGRYGFTQDQPNVTNWDSNDGLISPPVKGHSGIFKSPAVEIWGELVGKLAAAWSQAYRKQFSR